MATQGKRFAQDFERIDEITANDKFLIQDAETGIVMYANPSQLKGYEPTEGAVLYNKPQELTTEQQEQARENIGVSSDVFIAKRGETKYSEITEALADGKAVFAMNSDNRIYMFSVKLSSNSTYRFVTCSPGSSSELQYLQVNTDNEWIVGKSGIENTNNKVTSISSLSTDTQYPSAKAVYTALQSSGSIFIAKYDETTFNEVTQAINAGKAVFALKDSLVYSIGTLTSTYVRFSRANSTVAPAISRLELKNNNYWSSTGVSIEKTANKVTSITNQSTDDQYPSSKATYSLFHNSNIDIPDAKIQNMDGAELTEEFRLDSSLADSTGYAPIFRGLLNNTTSQFRNYVLGEIEYYFPEKSTDFLICGIWGGEFYPAFIGYNLYCFVLIYDGMEDCYYMMCLDLI